MEESFNDHEWAVCLNCSSHDVSEVFLYATSRFTCRRCGEQWCQESAGG